MKTGLGATLIPQLRESELADAVRRIAEHPGYRLPQRVDGELMRAELVLAALCIVAADQLTKYLVARRVPLGRSIRVGPIQIRHVAKPARGRRLLLALWIATVCILGLLMTAGGFFSSSAAQIGVGSALGGSASNLSERLRYGEITDFVDLGWWPVFNLADVAITAGIIVALWFIR